MQARHEIKFHISPLEAEALSRRLAAVMHRDRHADKRTGEYTIRSLYFDDAWDSAFHDKLDGVMHRDKYRIRIYNTPKSPITIERKRKIGDLIQKDGVRITERLARQLMRGDPTGLESLGRPLLTDVAAQMRTRLLKPAVIVEYDREAFTYPAENVRITIDKRVRSGLSSIELFDPQLRTLEVMDRGTWVLEVKYDNYLPTFLSALIGAPAERSAISKYTLCRRFDPSL
ncbi:MAG: polyphosphate polymerase domain-containing protein [Eubacteriales bacterium]|nr:polyphosphate polymerase domain-containing protein [Eubacteriales bacterium]